MLDTMKAGPFASANLIIHQGIANTLHQIIKLPCILRAVEEICGVLPGRHRDHDLADIFQSPDNPHASDSASIFECGLTIPAHPFSLPLCDHPDEWVHEATRKAF